MALYLTDLAVSCALGDGLASVGETLFAIRDRAHSPLIATETYSPGRSFRLGTVNAELPAVPARFPAFDCRNNAMLAHLYEQIAPAVRALVNQVGEQRVGIVLATSTSGIDAAEAATHTRLHEGALPSAFHFMQQQLSGGTDYLAASANLQGPTMTISTACSSSANALASAARMIESNLVDGVVVGGVDTLCQFTVRGFAALEAMSAGLSNPFSTHRDGINLGEGGALFLLSRWPTDSHAISLLGVGQSSDAHHISAPHPDGRGAHAAMQQALDLAKLEAASVDYVNLHGTGTPHNDIAEGRAVHDLLGDEVACSSTKPMTGHTLGAAGILETALCWLTLNPTTNPGSRLPSHLFDGDYDADIPPLNLTDGKIAARPSVALSNSFAFGGNNACVILGQTDTARP